MEAEATEFYSWRARYIKSFKEMLMPEPVFVPVTKNHGTVLYCT